MRRKWNKPKKVQEKAFCANQNIKAPYVYLIDQEGENVGKIKTEKAILIAKEFDLDLVEVNPKADPPVARIIDLGQLKYKKEKQIKLQKSKQKKSELKEVRLSVNIGEHDFNVRLKNAIKFLEKGNKLKISLTLKGREKAHPEKGVEIVKKFSDNLKNIDSLDLTEEQALTKQGGRYTMILINGKLSK